MYDSYNSLAECKWKSMKSIFKWNMTLISVLQIEDKHNIFLKERKPQYFFKGR